MDYALMNGAPVREILQEFNSMENEMMRLRAIDKRSIRHISPCTGMNKPAARELICRVTVPMTEMDGAGNRKDQEGRRRGVNRIQTEARRQAPQRENEVQRSVGNMPALSSKG
jgi:hypothetical protein